MRVRSTGRLGEGSWGFGRTLLLVAGVSWPGLGACTLDLPTAGDAKPPKSVMAGPMLTGRTSVTPGASVDPEWVTLRDELPSLVIGPVAAAVRDAKTRFVQRDAVGTITAIETAADLLENSRRLLADPRSRWHVDDAIANLRRIARRIHHSRPVDEAELDGSLWAAYFADFKHVRSTDERADHLMRAARELRGGILSTRNDDLAAARLASRRARSMVTSELATGELGARPDLTRHLEALGYGPPNTARMASLAESVERLSRSRTRTHATVPRHRPRANAPQRWTTDEDPTTLGR